MLESLGEDNIMIKKSFIRDTSLEMVLEVHILSYTEMQWEEYVSERINIDWEKFVEYSKNRNKIYFIRA